MPEFHFSGRALSCAFSPHTARSAPSFADEHEAAFSAASFFGSTQAQEAVALSLVIKTAEHKAFSQYLRHGTPPLLPLALQQQREDFFHKTLALQQQEALVAKIIEAAARSDTFLQRAALKHREAFDTVLQRTLGTRAPVLVDEPYLEGTLLRYQARYLRRLQALVADINPPSGTKTLLFKAAADPLLSTQTQTLRELEQILDRQRQQAAGIQEYIWRTEGDDKVRPSHAENDGKTCSWDDPPDTGHPGSEANCRCHAEPVIEEESIAAPVVEEASSADTVEAGINVATFLITLIPQARAAATAVRLAQNAERSLLAVRRVAVALGERGAPLLRRVTETLRGLRRVRQQQEDIFKRPEGVPEDWIRVPAKKGDGVKYVDPSSDGQTYVRISRGNPNASQQGQQNDYIRWQVNGKQLDKNGDVVLGKSEESHIPLEDFKFKGILK